jgi:hypothetical protein
MFGPKPRSRQGHVFQLETCWAVLCYCVGRATGNVFAGRLARMLAFFTVMNCSRETLENIYFTFSKSTMALSSKESNWLIQPVAQSTGVF